MVQGSKRRTVLALLAGAIPLVTVATCDESGNGVRLLIKSTNDDLLDDTLDFLLDRDDDD